MMVPKTLEEMKAEFARRGGSVQIAPAATAYGVNVDADRQIRAEARERRQYAEVEHRAEIYAEQTREAYHVGGSVARDAIVQNWRY
jgi:hypothetical protein